MGAKDSKPFCLTYEDARKRLTESEIERLKEAFKRSSNLNGVITCQSFIKEVLGEFVPLKLAEHIFQACGGTTKGITFKDLLCGLVVLTRGEESEKIRFIFSLCANENGTYVFKNDMIRLVQACDNGYVPEAVADCFSDSDRVTFDEFRDWLLRHRGATALTRWLLCEQSTVSLSNELETPTFYQTLAGVTHLQETDILDLEKRYWSLKTQSRTGRLDLDTLISLICPPVPVVLCDGIFNAFDENRDGHIDFKEMACGISACCRGPTMDRQKFCFKVFDQDRDGFLSCQELKQMARSLLIVKQDNSEQAMYGFTSSVTDEDVDAICKDILGNCDNNQVQSGILSLEQYLMWSLQNSLPSNFLHLLFQVCHIVFGLRPLLKEDEGDIIRSWLEREECYGMCVGQFWYLVSFDWWKSWNEYIDYQGSIPSGSCTPTYPLGSLKRTSKMQKKVDGSVAQTIGDSSSNVVLSSITSVVDENMPVGDNMPSLTDGVNGVLSSSSSENTNSPKMLTDSPLVSAQGSGVKKNTNLQLPEASSRTPSHSPVTHRKNADVPQRPPAIDNSSLIVPNTLKVMILTGEGGKIRKNPPPVRGRDYELVPEAVWRALLQWYGGSPPALPRQVISPRNSDHLELELHLVTLRLYRHQAVQNRQPVTAWSGAVGNAAVVYGNNPALYASHIPSVPKRYLAYLASFSHMATLRQVFEFLCMRLRLRPEDMRLWLYKDDSNLMLLEEEEYTLQQLRIEDNEQILIEVRNKDQTWPEEMSNVMNAKFDQKSQGPTEKGATGLNNLGNTCFMNAALQCVSNTRPLTLYFRSNKHLYELNRTNQHGMKGHIAKRYGDLIQDLWSGTSRTIAPLKLRLTIGKYAPRFNGFQQHDSQELLAFLIDGLHEDLNRVHEKPYTGLKDSDGRPDQEVAREAWENHVRREQSIIVDLFHGQLQSTVKCKVCGHTSVRFDPFNYLSLPLPMESCIHLEVVVVRLDGSIPVKYGLRLNHDDKYITLKQQLGQLSGVNPQKFVIAEVSGALIKCIPADDQRIRVAVGTNLFAYELYILRELIVEDDTKVHKEPQTLTQIQRMALSSETSSTVTSSVVGKDVPVVNANGDIPRVNPTANNDQETGNTASEKTKFTVGETEENPSPMNSQAPITSSPGPWMLGGGSTYPSSMTSSLVSNSSAVDLMDVSSENFIIAYHRKMIRQDVYFLSSQKTRPTLFGLPLVLPCHDLTTNQDLYQAVWTQVARLVSPLPPSETAVPNHAQDCDDSLGYEYPFTLKAVRRDGLLCATCQWYRFCNGCRIECCDADFNFGSTVIAIDWDPTALHLRYQSSLETVFCDHESVEITRRLQTEPINLHDCLEAFTKEEQLGEAEKYYCSKCKAHQLATKKLNIWRLPPILIVHLKRFQLLNGRWVKSHKIVKFPFDKFDPTDYLAQVPRHTVLQAQRIKLGGSVISGNAMNSKTVQVPNSNPSVVNSTQMVEQCTGDQVHPEASKSADLLQNVPSQNQDDVIENNIAYNHFGPSDGAGEGPAEKVLRKNSSCASSQEQHPGDKSELEISSWSQEFSELQDFHEHKLEQGDPFSLKYRLYALACHTGILGGGHYVCYACNPNGKWYCYNDSSCKEVHLEHIDTDSAYMLFYEREGVNYELYMPNVEGKIPDTSDIDTEFDTDFRKMCSVS